MKYLPTSASKRGQRNEAERAEKEDRIKLTKRMVING
jgi:hypothetical protein